MAIDIQQGDVKLFQTPDDGEISVESGIVAMSGGLDTMAYLCLFGGNYQDAGAADKTRSWWGNSIEELPGRMVRSETQYLIETLPAIPASLLPLRDAAVRDLNVFITEKIASEVTVAVSIPGLNRAHFDIAINAFGQLHKFEFTENWEQRSERKPKVSNQAWRDGTTGAIVGIYDESSYPIDDFGYPCFNGSLRAAYAAELTGAGATNPPWRRQCADGETPHPPTSLADLKGWPISDFAAGDCDSQADGDFANITRGYITFGVAGSVVGGKFRINNTGLTQSGMFPLPSPVIPQGLVEVTVERVTAANFLNNAGFSITVGGIDYGIFHLCSGGGVYTMTITRNNVNVWTFPSIALATSTGRITWDGATVRIYEGGLERYSEANAGGSSGVMFPFLSNHSLGVIGGNSTVDFSNTMFRNAATGGSLIHNSVVGMACP